MVVPSGTAVRVPIRMCLDMRRAFLEESEGLLDHGDIGPHGVSPCIGRDTKNDCMDPSLMMSVMSRKFAKVIMPLEDRGAPYLSFGYGPRVAGNQEIGDDACDEQRRVPE